MRCARPAYRIEKWGSVESARSRLLRAAARHSINAADAMAWASYRSGRYRSAARYERAALHLGTRDALYEYHAAMIDLRLGRRGAARRNLDRALATDAHFSILYAGRAQHTLDRLTRGDATS